MGDNPLSWIFALTFSIKSEDQQAIIPCLGSLPWHCQLHLMIQWAIIPCLASLPWNCQSPLKIQQVKMPSLKSLPWHCQLNLKINRWKCLVLNLCLDIVNWIWRSTGDNPLSWIFALTLSIESEDSMGDNPLSWIFALTFSIKSEQKNCNIDDLGYCESQNHHSYAHILHITTLTLPSPNINASILIDSRMWHQLNYHNENLNSTSSACLQANWSLKIFSG